MTDSKHRRAIAAAVLATVLASTAYAQIGVRRAELFRPFTVVQGSEHTLLFRAAASSNPFFDPQIGPPPESPSKPGIISRSLRRFAEDQKDIYSTPFRIRNLKWDALFLGGTGALVAADESASRKLPTSSAYISRNISNATILTTSAVAGSAWIYGLKTGNTRAKETGELTLEALANAFTVYTAMQLIAGRERPYEGTGEGSFLRHHSVNTAFPGGHAMFTFAMAGIMAHEFPHPVTKFLAYGAAGAVAASRFTARQHFLSDVAVGSLIGYLISREVFQFRCIVGVSPACHHRDKN